MGAAMTATLPQVLTLVAAEDGALEPAIVAEVTAALNDLGGNTADPVWLAERRAADIGFSGTSPEMTAAVRTRLAGRSIDLHAQPAAGRKKRLLLADMDSTIVTTETLDELAAFVGIKAEIAAITARAMNGELDFETALKERVSRLAGLTETTLEQAYADVELSAGAETMVRTMAAAGARCVLVSGGFRYFTTRVASRAGFHDDYANDFIIEAGKLTGAVRLPILTKDVKLQTLNAEASTLAISPDMAMAIGDGANDLPMIQAAGLGIAYRGKPVVAEAAPARIDFGDLTTALFFQGYTRAEFVGG
jgi:phosphoserine phosphatase